jgi:hypothetical protein
MAPTARFSTRRRLSPRWRHVVEQDDDPPRNRKELKDKVMKMFREHFDNPDGS